MDAVYISVGEGGAAMRVLKSDSGYVVEGDWDGQDAANAFTDINTWGTPKQILEKLDKRRQSLGDFDLTVQVSYGGLTLENAEASIRLFAKEVLPEFQSWKPEVKAA